MGFKQVNELRKSGQLQQAYDMAMSDWNQAPDDVWAARALFWTLHDMAFNELNRGYPDEAAVLAERMQQLLPNMGEQEEAQGEEHSLPERAMHRLVRHMQPFYADVKAAYLEARNGDTIAPYDFIAGLITDGQLAEPLHERAGWIIWHHLWRQQQRMPSIEARQALAHYMSLTGVEAPSLLHSRIMVVAIRLSKRFTKEFDFAKFMDIWGESNFMPEDWQRQERKSRHPGHPVQPGKFPALTEAAAAQYIACKKQQHDMTYSEDFMALLKKVVEQFPDRLELKRYLSLALLSRGDKESALQMHRDLAMKLNKYYVWHELAGMLTHDLDLKTSALCQALTMKAQENYVCDIHRELGWELAREGNMAAALCELQIYHDTRQRYGWHKSWRYEQLRKRIPADTVPTQDNHQLYAERAKKIIEWVYSDLPAMHAIVVGRFRDKQGKDTAKLVMADEKPLFVRANKIPADNYLQVRVLDDNGKLRLATATAAPRDQVVADFDNVVAGSVKVMQGQGGKQYGFVEGCFVPGHLLQGIATGDSIAVLTEMQPDGRRRAIAIL